MKIDIRDATPDDASIIAAFNQRIAQETEGKLLDIETIRAGVTAVFEDSSKGRYWIAECDGEIIAQLLITYEWSDWRNGSVWWIQSVYVVPDFRRRGVFSHLYRTLESYAREAGDVCGIRLYVEKNNERALATYEALGMTGDNYLVMEAMF